MPVVYTAVARRLNYPVKLVEAKSHLFCRWEADKERFNFDAAGTGISFNDDSFYRSWPKPISDVEIADGQYLRSLSAAEELGVFLAARGHNLIDNGRLHEAQVAYAVAHRLHPTSKDILSFLADAVAREKPPVGSARSVSRRARSSE
jgi:hypothetical protein